MISIDLPISKSIVNRRLIIQAMHGDPLMEVTCAMPDDVRLLHDALGQLGQVQQGQSITINCHNCGTAMRFLTAYCAQLDGCEVVLTGDNRMYARPIQQEVAALRQCGAQITYIGTEGFPPLRIKGTHLSHQTVTINQPLSTQFVSALMLIGIEVITDVQSPYIQMTQQILRGYDIIERDWSAAAFWYEYIALHGGEILLKELRSDSLQGDRVVVDVFRALGVETYFINAGARIVRERETDRSPLQVDFRCCPDLYPAVAITCSQLHKPLQATGIEALPYKESNRLDSVAQLQVNADHRMAMALMAADLPCNDTGCITKSYPLFSQQLEEVKQIKNAQPTFPFTIIIPRRGINDDNLGKKHALHQLIRAATTDYVWMMDDDVQPSMASQGGRLPLSGADMYILPLRMQGGLSLIERLQQAEYAAIQELTMRTAKRGRAVMCSGANLIVNRQRWLESYEDLHADIPSGDDMFALESFRRRGLRIEVIDEPDYTATISAQTSLRSLLRQRMRWAGKAPHYTDAYILRCGRIVVLANLCQLLCPLIILIKFPIEYSLIKKRDPEVSFGVALLLEVLYPFYMLLCLVGGFFRKQW